MTADRLDDALDVMHGLVLEDGRRWGEAAIEWQRADAAAILDVTGARRHFVTRPRGGSKTTDLAGVIIAVLLVQAPPASRSYAFASDREQAGLLLDAVAGFRSRTPGLGELVIGANKVTNTVTGATLEVMASDDASAWGLRPYLTVTDEIGQWPGHRRVRRLWSAILSGLPKVPDARLAALTSAGDPAHWSGEVLEEARRSERWRASEMPGPTPWIAVDELEEMRATLPAWEYRRLVMNEWTAADDRLTSVEDLRRCVTLDGPLPAQPGVQYVIGLDLGLKSDRTVMSVCHAEPVVSGRAVEQERLNRLRAARGMASQRVTPAAVRVVLDRQLVWQGSRARPVTLEEVEEAVAEASVSYGARVVADPWQMTGMAQRLRARRVQVEEFTFSSASVGRLAATLYQLLRDGLLALPDDEELLEELANVRLVENSPGVIRMDHDAGRHDDRAVSLALAAHALLMRPPVSVGSHRVQDLRLRGRR